MHYTVASKHIKKDNVGTSSTGVQLNKLVPSGGDVLTSSGLECCGTRWNVLSLHGGSGYNMSEEDCFESFLVSKKTV